MARNQIQTGMFGPLPHEVQQMQQLENERRALNVAQLDPNQRSVYHSSLAGAGMGAGINQIFGNEGEDMRRAKQMKAIDKEVRESGIDPSNFEAYYGQLGEKFAKAGLIKEAASVADALQAYKDKQATIETKKFDSETARIRAEAFRTSKLAKSTIAQEIFKKNKEYSPASLQAYLESITDDNPNGDLSKLTPYQEPSGWEVEGFTPDKKFAFVNKKGQVAVMGEDGKPKLYNGPIEKGTKGTNVSVGLPSINIETNTNMPAEDVMGKESASAIAQARKKGIDELTVSATSAQAALPVVSQMRELAKTGNLITQSARDQRLGLARIASTLGFSGWDNRINDSDFFDAFATEMVLPLMKQLGGSDSNEELRTLTKATANRTMSAPQIIRHLDFIEKKSRDVLKRYDEFNKGLAEGRDDIHGFDPVRGKWLPREFKESNQVGEVKQKVTEKNAAGKPAAPAQPNNNSGYSTPADKPIPPPPADLVAKWAKTWGVPPEEAAARLIQQRKARGL